MLFSSRPTHSFPSTNQTASRRGNSIVIALAATTVVIGVIALSTDTATYANAEVTQDNARGIGGELTRVSTLSALDSVLARRERAIITLAGSGDPERFVDFTNNYGVDWVGDTRVLWTIEPVKTMSKDGTGNTVKFISNPPPGAWTPPDLPRLSTDASKPAWQPNDVVYLFRVSGEAQSLIGDKILNRAQGVRFAAILKEPLFRYVIFYAQVGNKGDLELSHASAVNVQGSVHSNGAIYLGSGLKVNDKLARLGTFDAAWNPTATTIGPDSAGHAVRVNGIDGIFRLSKPLMFGIVNSFPLSDSSAGANTGVASWTADASYDLSNSLFPGEKNPPSDLSSVLAATKSGPDAVSPINRGKVINPYRFRDGSGAITIGGAAGLALGSADLVRTINAVVVKGGDGSPDNNNDSRDNSRSTAKKWAVASMAASAPGFAGKARTSINGGRVIRLPPLMQNRALEPQQLAYADLDSDPTTDDHEYARPVFQTASGTTTTFPTTVGSPVVEAPGQYLRYALGGGDSYMTRRADGTGWNVTTSSGAGNATDPATCALIIRERPIPDTLFWPGALNAPLVDPNHPRYLPYAYGKQWYPTTMPYTTVDISEFLYSGAADAWTNAISVTANNRQQAYAGSGRITITTAQRPGNFPLGGSTGTQNQNQKPYFYRDNWRFVHLATPTIDTSLNGLRLYVFDTKNPSGVGPPVNGNTPLYMCSGPAANQTVPYETAIAVPITAPANGVQPTVTLVGVTPTTELNSKYRSARFEGFITPTTQASYQFTITAGTSQGARVWVDGVLVAVSGGWGSGPIGTAPRALMASKSYPIVIDWYNDANASPSISLTWNSGSGWSTVPTTVLNPSMASKPVGYAKANFKAVQMKIASTSGGTWPKIGLMVRGGSGGISPVLNGGDAYAVVGYNPTRGFFSERRQTRATQDVCTYAFGTFFIGAGSGPSGAANTFGEITDNSTTVASVNRTAVLTPVTWPVTFTLSGITYGTQLFQANSNTAPTAYSGPLSKDIGGGMVWTLQNPFYTGPITVTRTWTPQNRSSQNRSGTLYLNLSGHVSPFQDAKDTGGSSTSKPFNIFTNATGISVLSNSNSGNTLNSNWYVDTSVGTATNRTRIYRGYGIYNNSNWVSGTPVSASATYGTATTLWKSSNYPLPQISKNGSAWTTASVSDINTFMGTTYTQDTRSVGTLQGLLVMPAVTYPANGSVPNPALPGTPTVPDFSIPRTFQVQRTGGSGTVTFDLNSWITAGATWFTTPAAQWLPWGTGLNNVNLTPATPPKTAAFRPDVWNEAVAPTSTSVAEANQNTATGVFADDVKPASLATATDIWLRIEKDIPTGKLQFLWYAGTTAPTSSAAFTELAPATGRLDVTNWGSQLLIGPCIQSGATTTTTTANLSDLKIELIAPAAADHDVNLDGVVDTLDWDGGAAGGVDAMSRYLASQYQVFWGNREITEDFFTFVDSSGNRLATEDWFYQTREFWSQSRYWDLGWWTWGNRLDPATKTFTDPLVNKDSSLFTVYDNRSLLAKTTVLTLDMREVQDYIKTRTFNQALVKRINDPTTIPTVSDATLSTRFNGLIYAVRTNRYPWNPWSNPWDPASAAVLPATVAGTNPFSPAPDFIYPNSIALANAGNPLLNNRVRIDTAWTAPAGSMYVSGIHKLLPSAYILTETPAIKPQNFHHGIRIKNASSIDWGYPAGGIYNAGTKIWTYPTTPQYGLCKTSIVTPNLLYIQGDLNTAKHTVTAKGVTTTKETPLAIMGDQVNLLSNAWQDLNYQQPGLTVANVAGPGSVTGTGSLVCMNNGFMLVPAATDTTYNAGVVTHNQPTTRDRVREGQAAPFVDTFVFLENWAGRAMAYRGSLVIMDSRRYTKGFLLDVYKSYGTTPFGFAGAAVWQTAFGVGAADWLGQSPIICSEPNRTYTFNEDFLTQEGTPPFTPFGVTATGVGNWTNTAR